MLNSPGELNSNETKRGNGYNFLRIDAHSQGQSSTFVSTTLSPKNVAESSFCVGAGARRKSSAGCQ